MTDEATVISDVETRLAGPGGHKDDLRLWLRLLACTALVEAEVRAKLRERFDMTLPRFDLMAQLERAPEGLTLGELSRRLMVSNGNVTGLVERLVETGHVRRLPHPTDRRVSYAVLTEAGRKLFGAMSSEHARWISSLMADMPQADLRTLLRLLGQLKQSVRSGIRRGARA